MHPHWLDRRSASDKLLHEIAEMGHDNARAMAAQLAKGANPRLPGPFGETPLILACIHGNAECVKLLLPVSDACAQCSVASSHELAQLRSEHREGRTPPKTTLRHTALSLAAFHGRADCVAALLPGVDAAGWTPLAHEGGRITALMATAIGAGLREPTPKGELPRIGGDAHAAVASMLIADGAPMALCGRASALSYAIRSAREDLVSILLPHSDLSPEGLANLKHVSYAPGQQRLFALAQAYAASAREARDIDAHAPAPEQATAIPMGRRL